MPRKDCPNGCGRSFRQNGGGLSWHLSYCRPAEPVAEPAVSDADAFADRLAAEHGAERCTCTRAHSGDASRCWRPRILGDGAPTVCWGCYSAGCDKAPVPTAEPTGPSEPASRRDDDGEPAEHGAAYAHDYGQPCGCTECHPAEPVRSWTIAEPVRDDPAPASSPAAASVDAFCAEHPMHDHAAALGSAHGAAVADARWARVEAERAAMQARIRAEIAEQDRALAARRTVVDYSAPMPAGYAIADPFGATAAEPIRPVRRGPADEALDMMAGPGWILPRADAERAGLIPAEPVAAAPAPARKARASRKAPSANVVRDGRDVIAGPVRVSFLDLDDLPPAGREMAERMLKNGGRGLAPARSRFERVLRVPDPLATAPAPIVGWRAPLSAMPAIEYLAERGAGDHRAVCSSWPRLESRPVGTAARERFTHAPRVGFRMTADPLATVARPPVLGPSTGRPVSHALAMGLRERAALAVAEPVAAAPAAVAVEMSPSLRASLTFAAGISRQGAARGRRARAA